MLRRLLRRLKRSLGQFLTRTRSGNKQPLNSVSLIVIILIDIFILVNVFTGLNDISSWALSPNETYPCYAEWQIYRNLSDPKRDAEKLRLVTAGDFSNPVPSRSSLDRNLRSQYQQASAGHLGQVSSTCLTLADLRDKIKNPANQTIIKTIAKNQDSIAQLASTDRKIRAQYDSTLLEQLSGQNRDLSINDVGAEKAKTQLEQNKQKTAQLKQEIAKLNGELLAKPESVEVFNFLGNDTAFNEVEKGFKQAAFWYPSIQITFQALFLLPLLIGAGLLYQLAERKHYALVALISRHLLIIFFIPLIIKVLEFLQVGVLFKFLFEIISAIFGTLLFLVSYAYILLIPIVGFTLIKICQKFFTKSRVSPLLLVQQSRCLSCAKILKNHESYCPHCGYHQHLDCHHCHQPTYKHLPYCKNCGTEQDLSRS